MLLLGLHKVKFGLKIQSQRSLLHQTYSSTKGRAMFRSAVKAEFWACRDEFRCQHSPASGLYQQLFSVNSAPVAAITWHQSSSDKQNKVDKPPNPKSSKRQQLPYCCAGVSQTETIHSKTAQEEGVQQGGYEVVSGILYTWFILSKEGSRTSTLNSIEGSALDRGVFHITVGLTTKLGCF